MKLRRHRRRHHTAAYVLLSGLAFGAAVPAVFGSRQLMPQFDLAALAAARDSFTLNAPLALIAPAGLRLDSGTLSISASQAPSVRTSEGLLKLLAGGKARLALNNASLSFTSAAATAAIPTALEALPPLVATLLGSRFEQLSIRHAMISLLREDGTALKLADVNAEVSLKRSGIVSAKGTFNARGQVLKFDVVTGLGDRKSATRLPFTATLDGPLLQVSLNGRISLGDGIQVSAQHANIACPSVRELAAWLGYDWPAGRGFERLSIQGNLDWVNQAVSVQQATIALDGNEATGIAYVLLDRARPQIDATLALRKLDLTPYLDMAGTTPAAAPAPPGSGTGTATGTGAGTGTSAPYPLPAFAGAARLLSLPILRHLDADLRLSAERITLAGAPLGRGAATLTAKAGRLMANVADFELETGGQGSFQLGVDMSGGEPSYSLIGRLRRIELAGLAPQLGTTPVVQGVGGITVDLTAHGQTGQSLAETLAGRAAATFNEGGQLGFDLVQLMATAKADGTLATQTAQAPPAAQSQVPPPVTVAARAAMPIDQLTARFTIAGGAWTTESLWASTGNAVYNATGTIYPPAQVLDLTVTRGNAMGNAGAAVGNAAAPLPAVQIRGPWLLPTVTPVRRGSR